MKLRKLSRQIQKHISGVFVSEGQERYIMFSHLTVICEASRSI